MKNNNIKSPLRTVLKLFLVNPSVFMFEWRRPWYSLLTGWSNLDHQTTWDYSKTTENACTQSQFVKLVYSNQK